MSELGRFQENPALYIEGFIKSFVQDSPENRLTHIDGSPIYGDPLVGFARGDDPLFQEYKKIIGSFHLTPWEALKESMAQRPRVSKAVDSLSVICWVLPIAEKTRRSNRRQKDRPSRRWAHARTYGEILNNRLREEMVGLLEGLGYPSVAPASASFFHTLDFPNDRTSNWSERHALYAAGLGAFGLSGGFITPRGVALRCGSVVTCLELPPTPRQYSHHHANCPFYVDGSCRVCIQRCPAQAITDKGHDKLKCIDYIHGLKPDPRQVYQVTNFSCGLCHTAVPCESTIPKIKAAAAPGLPASLGNATTEVARRH